MFFEILIVALVVGIDIALIVSLIIVFAGPPRATAQPRPQFYLERGFRITRVAPIGRRITSLEPLHDALARWHSRPLLLVNYLDNDQIQVTPFPKEDEWGISLGIRDPLPEPWDIYVSHFGPSPRQ